MYLHDLEIFLKINVKIDDYIGDGKGSCVANDRPCGEECINGLEFCLATSSCLRVCMRRAIFFGPSWPQARGLFF